MLFRTIGSILLISAAQMAYSQSYHTRRPDFTFLSRIAKEKAIRTVITERTLNKRGWHEQDREEKNYDTSGFVVSAYQNHIDKVNKNEISRFYLYDLNRSKAAMNEAVQGSPLPPSLSFHYYELDSSGYIEKKTETILNAHSFDSTKPLFFQNHPAFAGWAIDYQHHTVDNYAIGSDGCMRLAEGERVNWHSHGASWNENPNIIGTEQLLTNQLIGHEADLSDRHALVYGFSSTLNLNEEETIPLTYKQSNLLPASHHFYDLEIDGYQKRSWGHNQGPIVVMDSTRNRILRMYSNEEAKYDEHLYSRYLYSKNTIKRFTYRISRKDTLLIEQIRKVYSGVALVYVAADDLFAKNLLPDNLLVSEETMLFKNGLLLQYQYEKRNASTIHLESAWEILDKRSVTFKYNKEQLVTYIRDNKTLGTDKGVKKEFRKTRYSYLNY